MATIELSDGDGDAVTLTMDASGLWITCTTVDTEVTVGPFTVEALLSPLTGSLHR